MVCPPWDLLSGSLSFSNERILHALMSLDDRHDLASALSLADAGLLSPLSFQKVVARVVKRGQAACDVECPKVSRIVSHRTS